MNSEILAKSLVRKIIQFTFFIVIALSLLFEPRWSWPGFFFSVAKGLAAGAICWIFFLMVGHSLILAWMNQLTPLSALRREGGLLYHLLQPAENEIPDKLKTQKTKNKKNDFSGEFRGAQKKEGTKGKK